MSAPKNIVHISASDILDGRIKHVKEAEIIDLSKVKEQIGDISFANSEIVSTASDTGKFLVFKVNDETFAIKLYSP